jgi:hypothetical protein
MTTQDDTTGAAAAVPVGVTPQDLADIRRELFIDALAVARHDHDPSREWEAFAEAAWREAALAFGFVEREPWPEELPRPKLPSDDRDSAQRDSDDLS